GNLAVVESEGNRSILQNGLVLFTAPDVSAAEEAVHFPLLEHRAPVSVLMIGGGLNGSIAEVLKHPSVARVDYVELDPKVLLISRRDLPQTWSKIESDSRVRVHAEDGRMFVKNSDQRFDVIIVNLPEPQTAQLNRFYTEEFFAEAAAKLNSGGILALHLHGAEEYISPALAEFLASIHHTLRRVFPQVIAIPGEEVHLLGSRDSDALTVDPNILLARLHGRRIQTSYVREYYLPARMAPDRVADLRVQLENSAGRTNRDFAPSGYYFSVALWGAQFSNAYRDLFRSAAQVRFSTLLIATTLLTLFVLLIFGIRREKERRAIASARFAIASSGLIVMGSEIILLLGFEAIYGYVFDEIAIVIAGFMAGMAVGSWLAIRASRGTHPLSLYLLVTQIGMTALPIAVAGLLSFMNGVRGEWASALIAHGAIPLIAVACGVLGGYQFPIALSIARANAHSAGKLYGLDLLGAAVGAILLSTYLLPVFGFFNAALLMSVPSVGAVALICLSRILNASSTHSVHDLKTLAQ
ncbi:MAG TPA: fused MFS/spermidine synthase, partial [Terriglobales bacterium]